MNSREASAIGRAAAVTTEGSGGEHLVSTARTGPVRLRGKCDPSRGRSTPPLARAVVWDASADKGLVKTD